VTGFPQWTSIVSIAAASVIYTSIVSYSSYVVWLHQLVTCFYRIYFMHILEVVMFLIFYIKLRQCFTHPSILYDCSIIANSTKYVN